MNGFKASAWRGESVIGEGDWFCTICCLGCCCAKIMESLQRVFKLMVSSVLHVESWEQQPGVAISKMRMKDIRGGHTLAW